MRIALIIICLLASISRPAEAGRVRDAIGIYVDGGSGATSKDDRETYLKSERGREARDDYFKAAHAQAREEEEKKSSESSGSKAQPIERSEPESW